MCSLDEYTHMHSLLLHEKIKQIPPKSEIDGCQRGRRKAMKNTHLSKAEKRRIRDYII